MTFVGEWWGEEEGATQSPNIYNIKKYDIRLLIR